MRRPQRGGIHRGGSTRQSAPPGGRATPVTTAVNLYPFELSGASSLHLTCEHNVIVCAGRIQAPFLLPHVPKGCSYTCYCSSGRAPQSITHGWRLRVHGWRCTDRGAGLRPGPHARGPRPAPPCAAPCCCPASSQPRSPCGTYPAITGKSRVCARRIPGYVRDSRVYTAGNACAMHGCARARACACTGGRLGSHLAARQAPLHVGDALPALHLLQQTQRLCKLPFCKNEAGWKSCSCPPAVSPGPLLQAR